MGGFNGSGTFNRSYSWVNDKANSIDITASRFDTEDNGFATGLSTVICKDGQTTTVAVIPFNLGISASAGSTSQMMVGKTGELTTGIYSSGTGNIDIASGGTRVGGFTTNGLDNTALGGGTPAAAAVTTLNASGASTLTGAVALGSTINKLTLTAPATGSTLTITDGKTLAVTNTLTLSGTDSTVMTFPGTTDTVVTLAATQTLTNKTITALASASTGVTQSSGDNSTKFATTAYVDRGGGSAMVLLGSATANNSATSLAITGIPSSYQNCKLFIMGIIPATASGFYLQFGEGATPTWETSGYQWSTFSSNASSASGASGSTSDSGVLLTGPGTASGSNIFVAEITLYGLNVAEFKSITGQTAYARNSDGIFNQQSISGQYTSDGNAITAIRIITTIGNISSGSIYLYGLRTS